MVLYRGINQNLYGIISNMADGMAAILGSRVILWSIREINEKIKFVILENLWMDTLFILMERFSITDESEMAPGSHLGFQSDLDSRSCNSLKKQIMTHMAHSHQISHLYHELKASVPLFCGLTNTVFHIHWRPCWKNGRHVGIFNGYDLVFKA